MRKIYFILSCTILLMSYKDSFYIDDTMTIEEDVVAQTEQCFKNIKNILEEANSSLDKIVRITYILPKPSDFESCWPVLKKYLENIRPAATMFSADLFDKKIEIQVTALNK